MSSRVLFASVLVSLVSASAVLVGCGEAEPDTPDANAHRDAGGSVDSGTPEDAGFATDGAQLDAGLPADDGAVRDDASIDLDAGVGPDGGAAGCTCDVTVLCDDGCACDIACSIVPSEPPLGGDALLLDRAEIAVYFPAEARGPIERVALYDDGYTGAGGPAPVHRALVPSTARPAMAIRPVTFASDIDDDGRDEVVRVGPTEVIVEDWSGTALTPRTVHTYPAASSFDAAAGDLDGDGGRDLVISRQSGTTLTLEVLSLGPSGSATVRASTTLTSVTRHAITTGRTSAGEVPQVVALVGSLGSPGTVEPLRAHRFTLSGASLVAGAVIDVGGECLGSQIDDEGMAIAVGDLDGDAPTEIVTAFYCRTELWVKAYDPGAPFSRRWQLAPSLDETVAGASAVRPLLAMGRVGANARSAPMIVVGTNSTWGSSGERGPRGRVTVLQWFVNELRPYASRDMGTRQHSMLTALAVRDLDRDGMDEIVVGYVEAELERLFGGSCSATFETCVARERAAVAEVHRRDLGGFPRELVRTAGGSPAPDVDFGPGVVLAAGDLDADSTRVRATGNVYLHTGRPFVNAVLAAPPTWRERPGTTHGDASGTSFGTSMSMGTSETRTINASAAVTVSAGASFGPLVEFSASVTASVELSASSSFSESVSYGTETSVGDDTDLVLFRTIPYASYEYEVISHPTPSEIGSLMTIDVPGTMIETVRTLDRFRAEYGAEADDVIPPGVLDHTIGDPSTYRAVGDCTDAALAAAIGVGTVTQARPSPMLVDVGDATSASRTQTMSVATQTGTATEISLSVSMSVGVGAGGVSVEASAGIGTSSTHETTVGRDVTYSGTVSSLATGYGIDTRYEWGLCVFHFTSPRYGAYPVIDYVVRRY